MYKFTYILAIVVLLVGCSTATVDAPPAHEGAITCVHTHDDTRNFTYMQPVKKYEQTLFGEIVITYEFILTSGDTHFISGAEEENYECELAN